MALTGEQAFYDTILPPDQENSHTFATLDDDFVPLALIWWQAQEQPPAENPLLPPHILTPAHVKLIRDIHAAQTEENILVMRTQQQRGVSALPSRIPLEVDDQRRLRLYCGTGETKTIRI